MLRVSSKLRKCQAIFGMLLTAFFHFNFVLGHFSEKANAAADYLSRTYVNPDTKLKLKFKDRIPIHDIEIKVLANTPDKALNILVLDFIIRTITIEHVENTDDI